MAQSVTVGTLVTRVRDRIDRPVDDGFITDTEIMRYLDSAYKWLYNMLASKELGQYEKIQSITADGSIAYALTSDYYAVMGVEYQISSTNRVSLPRIQLNERNLFNDSDTGHARAWRIYGNLTAAPSEADGWDGGDMPDEVPSGDVIQFYPRGASGDVYRVFYIPVASTLDGSTDTVNGVNGFEELLVIEASIRCFMKEESSTVDLERERKYKLDEIDSMAENRQQESPNRVVDHELSSYSSDDADWWPGQDRW